MTINSPVLNVVIYKCWFLRGDLQRQEQKGVGREVAENWADLRGWERKGLEEGVLRE